jgi:hypothetical protein
VPLGRCVSLFLAIGIIWSSAPLSSVRPTTRPVGDVVVLSRTAGLVRTAPDLAKVDPLSAEVTTWLDRAYQTVLELDPIEAGILQVHAQFLHNDVPRHCTEIVEALIPVD